MKLSTLTAKLTDTKAVRALAITAVAGAALMAAAPSAQAQHVAFGVQFGTPVYVDPAPAVVYQQGYYNNGYYNNGYYDGDRYAAWRAHEAHEQWERQQEAWRRHEAWERHEEHERMEHMRPYGYGYGGGYYRHHDDDDR